MLEIGAGRGTLTRVLLARGARVIAIEKDRRLLQRLEEELLEAGERGAASRTVRLVGGDALHLDWPELVAAFAGTTPRFPLPVFRVIGNIPYAITSPLIEKALTPPLPERIVFLMQREVADRLAALPGTRAYGALSVGVQASCRVERLFVIRAGAFRPPPRVDSAVVRLFPLADPPIAPQRHASFRAFVTSCFGARRKQLRNVVAHVTGQAPVAAAEILVALGLDPAARPETLTPAQFVALARGALVVK